ncbi:hypothetical protein QCA50_005192 [Cerrena zonata]|uniref:NADH:flavin oxidoreductase/NADH oxidase N-terminal domain-containing protein n=1 Tax=Cerrena zonata TaxID=2478898 RepID=A0AAW0GKW9_9APHY
MATTQALFKSIQVGPLTIKNRIVMSALTRSRSVPKDVPNALNVEYYRQRAAGGCGLIVTEGVLVSQQGTEWPNAPGIWSKEQTQAWKKVVDAVHAEGSVIFAQLWHTGRVSHPDMPAQKKLVCQTLPGLPGYVTPTEVSDPATLVELFKRAAENAKEAGFDGVEAHGANGYLIHEFLDSTSNKRTDKWGGSKENRSRFGLEVLKALTDVFGADRVAIKLSPTGGYNDMGMPLEETLETFNYFVSEVNKLNLAYIALVRYSPMLDPTERGTKHDVIASYGHLITAPTKVVANCGFTPEEAAQYIEEGKADLVAFGFAWITHPDFANRVQHGKPLDNAPDFATLYGTGASEAEEAKGYTDYPAAVY